LTAPSEAADDRWAGTVIHAPLPRPVERRSLIDRAHSGDIEGALGRVVIHDAGPRRSWRRRLATLLGVIGPGVVVMVADNDAGSISVYGQAGQNYGTSLLWLLLPLAGMLCINQEMVARLGAVTGAGHARLIYERFGSRWGSFALFDLIALCLLTIVTELIGVDFAAGYLGVSRYVSVPVAAVALLAMTAGRSFRRWERLMGCLVMVNLVVIPLAIRSRPQPLELARAFVPGLNGSPTAGNVLFVLALAGATVVPWQLFFHQSNVVDKRITSRWLAYERTDTVIGTLLFVIIAVAILAVCAFAFDGTPLHGQFVDAGNVASGLGSRIGHSAGVLFAVILLNGSVLGAVVVTLGASYAVGDVLGVKHSLHRRWSDAPTFYGIYAALVLIATIIVLAPDAPLGVVTTAVQALAGVLLPSALVFLVLLCNDREVLGPWVNPPWLNAVAVASIGVLLALSALLTFTTLVPTLEVKPLVIAIAVALTAALAVLASTTDWRGDRRREHPERWSRTSWTMPPLDGLPAPVRSRGREIGLVILRSYLALAALVLVAKTLQSVVTG
jgi:NRAMP (natural resistance-associated macrophage protein)-like metal ion transporter